MTEAPPVPIDLTPSNALPTYESVTTKWREDGIDVVVRRGFTTDRGKFINVDEHAGQTWTILIDDVGRYFLVGHYYTIWPAKPVATAKP